MLKSTPLASNDMENVMIGFLIAFRAEAGTVRLETETPNTTVWDGALLARSRAMVKAGDPWIASSAAKLRKEADDFMDKGPWAITETGGDPPSGDKHDYYSVGSYWWPCTKECNSSMFANCSLWKHSDLGPPGPPYAVCNKSTGLPWYDHDGYHNPVGDTDKDAYGPMTDAAQALALAGYVLDEPKYSARAALVLRTWFVDPKTRMNPNAEYAQGVPGRNKGRGIGIIDFTHLPYVLDSARLLEASGSDDWSKSDKDALEVWARDWEEWLLGSKNGRDEAAATNNHGSWYDLQAAAIGTFNRNASIVDKICSEVPSKRIDVQVDPTGSLPMEDKRTKSLNYHTFDTDALMLLAWVCRRHSPASSDLFSYVSKDGRALRKVIDWFTPYAANASKPWPYKQVTAFDRTDLMEPFRLAAMAPEWSNASRTWDAIAMQTPGANSSRINILYPFQL